MRVGGCGGALSDPHVRGKSGTTCGAGSTTAASDPFEDNVIDCLDTFPSSMQICTSY